METLTITQLALTLLFIVASILPLRHMKREAERALISFRKISSNIDTVFPLVDKVLANPNTPSDIRRTILILLEILQSATASRKFFRYEPIQDVKRSEEIESTMTHLRQEHPELYEDVRGALVAISATMAVMYLSSPAQLAAMLDAAKPNAASKIAMKIPNWGMDDHMGTGGFARA